MNMFSSTAVTLALIWTVPASAKSSTSVIAEAQIHDYSDQRGSLRTFTLEYRRDIGGSGIMVGPTWAEQRLGSTLRRSAGGKVAFDLQLTRNLTSRTQVSAASNPGIVPLFEVGQELGLQVHKGTVATFGIRYARFQGEDATFSSAGLRRYFKGGSIAYRLTRTAPERGGAFFAHLANLAINDGSGTGRTQLWLAHGASADNRLPSGQTLSGRD